jgi:tetraprenyl-beta-curcumene synthase
VSIFASHRIATSKTFIAAAARYWVDVFPCACREIRGWEQAAQKIPDPLLRTLALRALREERGNLEGAAAYAAITPRRHRTGVVRAVIAFQAVYDYADALSEQPDSPSAGIRRLHQALLVALRPGVPHLDYYEHQNRSEDGAYLHRLVDRCRSAVASLPSFPVVAFQIQQAASRIITYQCLNHQKPDTSHHAFACWAAKETDPENDLRWWETGAAAGSSLAVFALIAVAAQSDVEAAHVTALGHAYFPWIGSLHTLLDSLIDEHEDAITGQHCLTARYASLEETVSRLKTLALRASEHAEALPDSEHHMMMLAAMVSFYFASPQASDPRVKQAAKAVLPVLGDHAQPAMCVLRARHILSGRRARGCRPRRD